MLFHNLLKYNIYNIFTYVFLVARGWLAACRAGWWRGGVGAGGGVFSVSNGWRLVVPVVWLVVPVVWLVVLCLVGSY